MDIITYSKASKTEKVVNGIIKDDVLYDAVNADLTGHTGMSGLKYCLNVIIPKDKYAVISVNVYSDCTFNFYFVSKENSEVVGIQTYSFVTGINTVIIANTYNADVYLAITGDPDTIYVKTGGTMTKPIKVVASTGNYSIGRTVTVPSDSSPEAMFAITVIVKGDLILLDERMDDAEENITMLQGGKYSSKAFEPNASASAMSSFMLLQPAPFDGLVTKVKCKAGVNKSNVGLAVYEWTNTAQLSNISKVHDERVIFIDSIADVAVRIKKGQYIGINYNVSSTCAAHSQTAGAGYISLPTEQGASSHAGEYVTLSYEMIYGDIPGEDVISPLKDKIIFLAGDSRSSTDYAFYKSTLTKKTGADVLVKGASGKVASYIASNAYFDEVIANPHDFSIWIVGGNDVGRSGDVGTFSATSPNGIAGEDVVQETDITQDYSGTKFIQAIDHIIRKYRAMYYDFKTVNDGHKYRMIMCTDLPQNRNNSADEYSQKANWERKVNAIIEACQKNNIPCLDLYHLCGFDMSQEPYWTSPTDKLTDNGIYYMDGLHPNQYGIDIITSLEVEEMKKYVSINTYTAPST